MLEPKGAGSSSWDPLVASCLSLKLTLLCQILALPSLPGMACVTWFHPKHCFLFTFQSAIIVPWINLSGCDTVTALFASFLIIILNSRAKNCVYWANAAECHLEVPPSVRVLKVISLPGHTQLVHSFSHFMEPSIMSGFGLETKTRVASRWPWENWIGSPGSLWLTKKGKNTGEVRLEDLREGARSELGTAGNRPVARPAAKRPSRQERGLGTYDDFSPLTTGEWGKWSSLWAQIVPESSPCD